MLQCRSCNTRYRPGLEACPSCGRRGSGASVAGGESGPLPQAANLMSGGAEEIDLDLDEDSVVGQKPLAQGKPVAALGSAARRQKSGDRRPGAAPATPAVRASSAGQAPDLGPEQVRAMLAEQPGLLEKGLALHADEDGEPLGIDFPTPVGSIDLLGRDRKGAFVVVHVPTRDEIGESVSSMLRRMGWVRKHLARTGEEVRGIVVVDHLPEDVAYAAAGAGGAIAFKGYQMALSFHDFDQ